MYRIVAFEGIDGSGKTTIIQKLREKLGKQFPHPLFLDRFLYSAYVFERLNDRDRFSELNEFYLKSKDLVAAIIYLDVSPEVAIVRAARSVFEYDVNIARRLQLLYTMAFQIFPNTICYIDANQSLEGVVKDTWKVLKELEVV